MEAEAKPVSQRSGTRHWIVQAVAVLCAVAAVLLFFHISFGTVEACYAWVSGFAVYPEDSVVDMGHVEAGQPVSTDISIKNLSASSVTIVGAETDCSCSVASGLPLEIAPSETGRFSVQVTPSEADRGRPFENSVALLLDTDSRPVVVRIRGTVNPNSPRDD